MLITYLLKVSLLLAILTLGYRWLIHFETFSKTNRVLLWFNILSAWSLPFLPLPNWGPIEVQHEIHQQIPRLIKSVPEAQQKIISGIHYNSIAASSSQVTWTIADLILLIYISGMALMICRFFIQLFKLAFALKELPSLKLDNGIILITNKNTLSPYSFFKWIVCNPERHTKTELEHIIAHETEHVNQRHSIDLLLAEIQRILLWFNPFAWLHKNLVQENLEYLADRAVLENGFQKKQYQFSLLKAVMQHREIPLTNSFAQSLLKKRIKMMNRKPSKMWVAGKYASLIAVLYFSSAFVAPYTKNVATLIPDLTHTDLPELLERNKNLKTKTGNLETELKESKTNVVSTKPPKAKRSKWVIEKGGTLYWAISPLATWEDINEVRQEIKKFGGELAINAIEYDPFQFFITSLAVNVKSNGSKGSANQNEGRYTPVKSVSGYIKKGGQLGMGQTPPEPLNAIIEKDYAKALLLEKRNRSQYLEDRITTEITKSKHSYSGRNFSLKDLKSKDAELTLKAVGIEKAFDNTLTIMSSNKFANFYLNASNSSLSELNTLSFNEVENINIIDDRQGQRYIFVRTK